MAGIDFETEFMSDDEVEEILDNTVVALSDAVSEDENRTSIANPYVLQKIANTYKLLKYALKGSKAKVTYALHQPYHSMGYISVVGKDVAFKNPKWFVKAVEMASNFEVYAKTNGDVEMNFTFHGLTKPIE